MITRDSSGALVMLLHNDLSVDAAVAKAELELKRKAGTAEEGTAKAGTAGAGTAGQGIAEGQQGDGDRPIADAEPSQEHAGKGGNDDVVVDGEQPTKTS